LEAGTTKLEEAVAAYERGSLLRQHCETKLREAQLRVEQIAVSADGEVTAEPVKID
jgi:exodeoxyribonuclease VII small subunit